MDKIIKIKNDVCVENLESSPLRKVSQTEFDEAYYKHLLWLAYKSEGERLVFISSDLSDMHFDNLLLKGAVFRKCKLLGSSFLGTELYGVDFNFANLTGCDFRRCRLQEAYLLSANLNFANLSEADLTNSNLHQANLDETLGLIKKYGFEVGNYYWKRCDERLTCRNFQFKLGLNTLRPGEVFADDPRRMCSYPGFHFASRDWCAVHYGGRPYEIKIRIPEKAQINEPWASDGKASADMIEVIEVWKDGMEITSRFRNNHHLQ